MISTPPKNPKIPQADYGFLELIHAQALGDLQALEAKQLPVFAFNLGRDDAAGLQAFAAKIKKELA